VQSRGACLPAGACLLFPCQGAHLLVQSQGVRLLAGACLLDSGPAFSKPRAVAAGQASAPPPEPRPRAAFGRQIRHILISANLRQLARHVVGPKVVVDGTLDAAALLVIGGRVCGSRQSGIGVDGSKQDLQSRQGALQPLQGPPQAGVGCSFVAGLVFWAQKTGSFPQSRQVRAARVHTCCRCWKFGAKQEWHVLQVNPFLGSWFCMP